jgi:hypothetical protein
MWRRQGIVLFHATNSIVKECETELTLPTVEAI